MDNVDILQITSDNIYYGGSHDGTFTVDIEGVKNLRELLAQAHKDLCNLVGRNSHATVHDTIDGIESLITHLDEHLQVDEDEDE